MDDQYCNNADVTILLCAPDPVLWAWPATYSYLAQVDPIVEWVPGTLLVVGFPWLLKHLTHTLSFLPLDAITPRDARGPRDAIVARVTLPSRGASRTLGAAVVLENERGRERGRDGGRERDTVIMGNKRVRQTVLITTLITYHLELRNTRLSSKHHMTYIKCMCPHSWQWTSRPIMDNVGHGPQLNV